MGRADGRPARVRRRRGAAVAGARERPRSRARRRPHAPRTGRAQRERRRRARVRRRPRNREPAGPDRPARRTLRRDLHGAGRCRCACSVISHRRCATSSTTTPTSSRFASRLRANPAEGSSRERLRRPRRDRITATSAPQPRRENTPHARCQPARSAGRRHRPDDRRHALVRTTVRQALDGADGDDAGGESRKASTPFGPTGSAFCSPWSPPSFLPS